MEAERGKAIAKIIGGYELDKVCVTALTLGCYGVSAGYAIYVVDVSDPSSSSDCIPSVKPALELDMFDFYGAAVVVSGTKLYVFGGLDMSGRHTKIDEETYSLFIWKSHAYAFDIEHDLFSSPTETRTLRKTSAYRRLPMGSSKFKPVAAVVDDHRICVFSVYMGDNPEPNFELFDTRDESFTPLPEVPNSPLFITSFFATHSALLVLTDDHVLYRLNFDRPEPQWEAKLLSVPESHRFDPLGFCVARGVFACNSALCTPFEVLVPDRCPPVTYPIPLETGGDKQIGCLSGGMFSDGRLVYVARAGDTDSEEGFFLWFDLLMFYPSIEFHPKPINFCSLRFSVQGLRILIDGCYPVKRVDSKRKARRKPKVPSELPSMRNIT